MAQDTDQGPQGQQDPAQAAADGVLDNLKGRSGIGNAFDEVDDDIQAEIREEIAQIIRDEFSPPVVTPGVVEAQPVEPGSVWKHRNGNLYAVLLIANEPDEARYPRMIVYQGENGRIWARRANDWHRSMTLTGL